MSDNNNDDFQDDEISFDDPSSEGGMEDFEGGGTTLGDMWRNNPLVKIVVIAGGLLTVIGAIILFGGGDDPALRSQMRTGTEISEAPGGDVSESYKEALRESNMERTEEAIRNQGSVLPTPIDSPVRRLTLPEDDLSSEDPLERWRRIQEERQRQTGAKKPPAPVGNPHAEAIDSLATAMAAQMEGILDSKKPLEPVHEVVTDLEWLEALRKKEAEELATAKNSAQGGLAGNEIVNILIPAGTIEYAQLLIEANSDIEDGPALAHLVSGPLAGARLLGEFEVEEEYLVLTFNVIVIDGIAHRTEAIALDPDTTLPGMATEVDHRYFKRVILPAAAAFVEGMGEAIADTNQTTVVATGGAAVSSEEELDSQEEFFKGFEKSAEKVGELLDEEASQTKVLVRVEAGTPLGLLFIQPVTDETGSGMERAGSGNDYN